MPETGERMGKRNAIIGLAWLALAGGALAEDDLGCLYTHKVDAYPRATPAFEITATRAVFDYPVGAMATVDGVTFVAPEEMGGTGGDSAQGRLYALVSRDAGGAPVIEAMDLVWPLAQIKAADGSQIGLIGAAWAQGVQVGVEFTLDDEQVGAFVLTAENFAYNNPRLPLSKLDANLLLDGFRAGKALRVNLYIGPDVYVALGAGGEDFTAFYDQLGEIMREAEARNAQGGCNGPIDLADPFGRF